MTFEQPIHRGREKLKNYTQNHITHTFEFTFLLFGILMRGSTLGAFQFIFRIFLEYHIDRKDLSEFHFNKREF